MDVVTYTGTGSTLTPTSSLGFSPDLVWIKSRSAATDNTLYDVVRGAQARLESNNTDAEVTSDNGLTAFNSAGFTLGTLAQVNTSSATYAAWTWDAGSSTVTNTQGSISSQVRANASAGFSIVTWTPQSTAGTVGHGLGVAPEFIITKDRDVTTAWFVYHKSVGTQKYLLLNQTGAATTNSTVFTAAPTSTVFDQGTGFVTGSGYGKQVCYCFAPVAGYSAFGSYTGNGSADGPFVFTGFRPRWVMIKSSSNVQNWMILDAARRTYNAIGPYLWANSSTVEDSAGAANDILDITSNGFKLRGNYESTNYSSYTYIYAAFAESPFQYSRAR